MNPTYPVASRATCTSGLAAGWLFVGLIAPIMMLLVRATQNIFSSALPFDTAQTYLPLARRLLADPEAFFVNPDSLSVAPGIYVFMALCNADPELIRGVNIGLSLAVLLMLFDTGYRLAGPWAATAATWLYACSPVLKRHIFWPMSESIFVSLVMLWLWLTLLLLQTFTPPPDAIRTRRPWQPGLLALAAGLALGAATLTRGTYMYWIPTIAVLCALIGLTGKPTFVGRNQALRLLASHLVALAVVGAYMAKNEADFDRPIIATGAGAALYYGNNPVINGGEPPHYGLEYDDWAVTRASGGPVSHLSIEGDRRLATAAQLMLAEASLPALASMYWHKLGAILFFSKNELERHVFNNRAWRVLLLVLATYGLWTCRQSTFAWLVAGALIYQTTVHLPVLFNSRYSIGALDLPLTALAAVGLRGALQVRQRPYAWICICLLVLAGSLAGAYHQRHGKPLMPDLAKGPHTLLAKAELEALAFTGLQGNPFTERAVATSAQPAIAWRNVSLDPQGLAIVRLGVQHLDTACRSLRLTFRTDAGAQREIEVDLEGRSENDPITKGLKDLIAPNSASGTLTATFDCPVGSVQHLEEFALYRASPGLRYGPLVAQQMAAH